MRRVLVLSLALVALVTSLGFAQEEETEELEVGRWYNFAEAALNLTQASYSSNWKGGENGSLAWSSFLNATAQRRFSNDLNWLNILRLRFGQQHQQKVDENGNQNWLRPEKTEDKVDLESILRLMRGWEVDPYASGRFESQFLDISDPLGRNLNFNPMTFKESAGVSRRLYHAPEEAVLSRLGFTLRQNYRQLFTTDDPNVTTTDGQIAHDGGLEFQADWRVKFGKDKIGWLGKLTVYQPFAWSEATTFDQVSADSLIASGIDPSVKDFTTAVDIGWENTFTTQITKWIAFNLYVEFVYDKYDNSVVPVVEDGNLTNPDNVSAAIREAGQYKQTFAIGITYRFL